MTEPEQVIYERFYTVTQDFGAYESYDCATAQEAAEHVVDMLVRGIYSVKVFRFDRERKIDA